MMCGKWNPERLNRFLPLSPRAEGTCGLEDIENISLRSLAGCYDGVIINFSLFWWDSSPGSRRCKGVNTHCLSRCRILWADAKCWLRHLSPPPPLMLFLHGEQEQPASDPVNQCCPPYLISVPVVERVLSHCQGLCCESSCFKFFLFFHVVVFVVICFLQFIIGSSSVSMPRGLWRSLSAVSSGSFPTNC